MNNLKGDESWIRMKIETSHLSFLNGAVFQVWDDILDDFHGENGGKVNKKEAGFHKFMLIGHVWWDFNKILNQNLINLSP